jgi:signal transduction histidine kinase
MRTQIKLVIVIFISVLVTIITFGLVYKIKSDQGVLLTNSYSHQLQNNIAALLKLNSNNLLQVANDYSFWDELVDFTKRKDSLWGEQNINTILASFKTEAVWVFDSKAINFYTVTNPGYGHLTKFPVSKEIIKDLHKRRLIHTFAAIGNEIVEITGATIHPTKDNQKLTEPNGYLFIAKVWSPQHIAMLGQITESRLWFTGSAKFAPISTTDKIVVFHPIKDWQNSVVKYLAVEKHIDFWLVYERSSWQMFLVVIFSGLLILSIFVYASAIWVNRPLRLTEEILKKFDPKKAENLKKHGKEFRIIGNLILGFFAKNEELKLAREKAERANRLKTSFLLNMSHEVRTPMNVIIGFSELLAEGGEPAEMMQHYSVCLSKGCSDLLHIINDILDISMLEAHEVNVNKQRFTVHSFISDLSDTYLQKLANKEDEHVELKILASTLDPEFEINSDKILLHKILDHLIDNALKFTHQGIVEVNNYLDYQGQIIFYVKDSGIGIPKDKLEIIFEQFRQVDGSATRVFGGNGLGLSICKGFIGLLGGRIWVESVLNEGSTFYISVPIK